jgi:mRNA-degrading endonuclease toxin of MazEF toxin-antitoxin module
MKRGDVVLVYVPFVGASGGKRRPAVVVQSDSLNTLLRETLIVEVTSNLANVKQLHQVLIDISTSEGASSGLLANSAVRCERLHLIPQSDVLQVIGTVSPSLMHEIDNALKAALGIS